MLKEKKLLVLTNSSGGLYNFRKELLSALRTNNNVYVIAPLSNKVNELKQIGIELIDISIDRRGINPIKDLRLLLSYIKAIKLIQPDLIITYTIKPNIYGGLAARLTHVNYAVNITGLGTAFQKKGILKTVVIILNKIALKRAKTVFFENSSNRDYMLENGIIKEEQSCLLNGAGVNLEKYSYYSYPKNNKPFSFLFIGRVMKEKGIDELFSAMKRLINEGVICNLDVLGNYEEDYKALIDRYASEGWLHYHGYQDDVIPFIHKTNCFVLPSWHEGMANTNLECASVGRPLITSDIPGCKEAVIDNKSGFLCKVKDYVSLYDKMKDMVKLSDNDRERMGVEGRKLMEKAFDRRVVVNKTIERLFSKRK